MYIDEKKLPFILTDYSVIREVNEAWFGLFFKIQDLFIFQFDVGCIPLSVCL